MAIEPTRLPLFPLPVVLFPGGAMPLHIFEPRYRRMVAHCREQDRPFGLIHHDWDETGPFLNEPGRVGTVAGIEAFRPLPDGRSLIRVRGDGRFRIVREVDAGGPYFEAEVTPYDDLPTESPGELRRRRRRSLLLFEAAARALDAADAGADLDPKEELSFALARRIRIDVPWQQALLELRDEARRLDRLDVIFRRALERIGEGEEARTGDPGGGATAGGAG